MQEKHERVVILFADLIPDQRRKLPGQFGKRRAFSVPRPCLQDGQAIVERLFDDIGHTRTR
jgi:hypothetical protein